MKRLLIPVLLALVLSVLTQPVMAQKGYDYQVTIRGMEDTVLYFGHHYGNKQYVIDTVRTDKNGTAHFAGQEPLPGGVYIVVMPKMNNKYFEMIVNEPAFEMATDTTDITGHMQVTGSVENQVMYDDLRFIGDRRSRVNVLRKEQEAAEQGSKRAEKIQEEMDLINQEVLDWRNNLYAKYPGTFYVKLLKASADLTLPEAPVLPDGTPDKKYLIQWVHEHYFDDIDLKDSRLLRSSVLHMKVEQYLNTYVPKIPDSVSAAIDRIIEGARGNNEVFQYLVVTLLNQYASSDIMGMDAVFVHMVDKYYKSGDAFWLDDAALFRITNKAALMKPTLIGKQAPPIMLQDSAGIDIPLYSIDSKYTVVVFWDVDCGHCKKEMPKLVEAYPKIKELGAEVYAVYTEEEWDKWKDWLNEKHYNWINVGNVKRESNFQALYNVDQTPLLFILDKNKKIIGKHLKAEQLYDFLKNYQEFNDL